MAYIEKLKCSSCKSTYKIEWSEDEVIDFVEAEYCPFCGYDLTDDYYMDEEEYEYE